MGILTAQRCIFIGRSVALQTAVGEQCRALDVRLVGTFASGIEADTLIKAGGVDLIVVDGGLEKAGAALVVNRLRASDLRVPVLIVKAQGVKVSLGLASEFPMVGVVEQPFSRERLKKCFEDLLDEASTNMGLCAEVAALVRELGREPPRLGQALRRLAQRPNRTEVTDLIIGEELLRSQQASQAEPFFRAAVAAAPEDLRALTALGVALHALGRTEETMECLRVASRLRSENVGGLCLLGELELAGIKPDQARQRFEAALKIDPEAPAALAGTVIAAGMKSHLTSGQSTARLPPDLASACNLVAIGLVRRKSFDAGIKQYLAAIHFVRDRVTAGRLMFNIALAYMRAGDEATALHWLTTADQTAGGKITKVKDALKRLANVRDDFGEDEFIDVALEDVMEDIDEERIF